MLTYSNVLISSCNMIFRVENKLNLTMRFVISNRLEIDTYQVTMDWG